MASGQRFDFTLGIRADITQAKQELNTLKTALNNLTVNTSTSNQFNVFNNNIGMAIEKTAQLRLELEKATKPNGALDLGKLATEWKKSGHSLDEYKQSLRALGPAGEQAFQQLVQSIRSAEAPVRELDGLIGKFTKGLLNTAMWTIQSNAIHGFQSALSGAFRYAQQLNKGLTDIAIVSDLSGSKLAQFAKDANKYAQQLSTTTNEYVKGALIYYQQGLSGEEVIEKTNTTVKLANTSGENAEQISSYMTAIWNNFDDGSKSVEYFADVISYLGAETAASNADIAEGMQAFAATANTVGLSYEYAASALTTLRHVTQQSASTIGNSLKTIFARLSSVSLGESLEDGVDLTKYTKALADVGVNVVDINGDLKAMDDILDDLADRWGDLTNAQKVAVAQTVGGVRQYNNLISLMDNYGYFQELVEGSTKSEGYLNKQSEIFEKSWKGALNHVQTAIERLYNILIDDKAIIGMTNALAKLIDVSGAFLENIGGLGTIIPIVFGFLSGAIGDKIAAGFERAKATLDNFFHYTEQYQNAEELWLKNFQEEMSLDNVGLTGHQEVVRLEEEYRKSVEKTLKLAQQLTIEDRAQITALAERNRQQVANLDNLALEIEALQTANQNLMADNGLTVQWGNGRNSHNYGAANEPDYDTRFQQLFKNYNAINIASNFLNNVHGNHIGQDIKDFFGGTTHSQYSDIAIPGFGTLDMATLTGGTGYKVFTDFLENLKKFPDDIQSSSQELETARTQFANALQRIDDEIEQLIANTRSRFSDDIDNQQIIVTNAQTNFQNALQEGGIADFDQLRTIRDVNTRNNITAAYQAMVDAQTRLNDLQRQHENAVHETVEGIRNEVTQEGILERNTIAVGIEQKVNAKHMEEEAEKVKEINSSLVGNLNALISIGTSLTVVSRTLNNMGDAISSGNWGKFFSNFATFGMQTARLVTSLQRIKPEFWTQGLGQVVTPVLEKFNITTEGGILGIKGMAEAGAGLGAKFTTLIPVIGKIVLAILAVKTATELIKFAWDNLSPTAKLKSLEEATEDAAKAAEDAKKEYDNLITSISSLKDKSKNIDEMDRGTQEWRDSVHELNKELQDLADKYGLTLGHGLKVENGHLALEDGFEEDIKQQETQKVNNANTIAADMAFGTAYQTFSNSSNSTGLAQFIQDFGLDALLKTDVGNAQVLQDFLNKQSEKHTVFNSDSGLYEYDSQFHGRGYAFDANTYGFDENAATELETLRTAIVARLLDEAANEGLNLSDEEVQEQATRLLGEIILNGLTDASTSDYANEFGLTKTGLTGARGYDFGDSHYDLSATRTAADVNSTFTGVVDSIQQERAGYGKLGARADLRDFDVGSEGYSAKEKEEMERYAEVVKQINKNWEEYGLVAGEAKEISEDLATDYINFNKGLSDVIKNYENYVDNLKNADTSSMDFINTIAELRNDLSLMLDIKPDSLGDDFFSEHRLQIAKDLEEAAKGNWDALYDLQELAAKSILPEQGSIAADLQDEFATAIANINNSEQWDDIQIGATFDSEGVNQDFADAMDELLQRGEITVEQLNNTLDAIGWEPKITWEKMTHDEAQKAGYKSYLKVGDNDYQEVTAETTIKSDAEVWVPIINRQQTTFKGSPKSRVNKSNKDGAAKNKGKGGGSSKDRSKEVDRYHEINAKIAENKHAIEMLDQAESRAYGQDKIDLMMQKIALLEEQRKLYEELAQEAQNYYDKDKANLEKYGATFNEDGTIANYDAWYGEWVKKYLNGSISEEQMQQIDDYIKKYEDSLKHLDDAEKAVQDTINQIFDLKLEKIEYRLKTIDKLIDQDLEYLDYMIKQLDKSMYDTADVIALIGKKLDDIAQKVAEEQRAVSEILQLHGLSEDEVNAFLNGQMSITEIIEKIGDLTDKEVEALMSHQSALLKYNETLIELREQAYEKLGEAIDEFNDKIERQKDIVSDLDGVMNHYRNIIDIVGKDTLGISDEMLRQMSELSVTAAKAALDISRDQLTQNQALLEAMYARREELLAAGREADAALMDQQIEAQEDRVRQLTEAWASAWEDALHAAEEAFKNSVKLATDAFSQAMSSTIGNLDDLQEAMEMQNTLNDRYLPMYQKIYELNKLTRDVNNAIDNTNNIAGKERLLKLQEDILKKQRDGEELTEYELGMFQRRLELTQAEIALEEAQNAKSMVRMTRDSEGNWSYTYTADAEAVDKAQQNYEDKLYDLKKYNQESMKEFESAMWQAVNEYRNSIADLDLTDEERAERIRKFQEQWVEHNKDMFQMTLDDAQWILDTYGGIDDLINTFTETVTGQTTDYTDLTDFFATFGNASATMMNEVSSSYKNWYDQYHEIFEKAGTSVDDFADKVQEDMAAIEEAMVGEDGEGGAVGAAKELGEEMTDQFDDIMEELKKWFTGENGGYSAMIDSIITDNERLYASIQSLLSAYADLGDISNYAAINHGVVGLADPSQVGHGNVPIKMATGGYTGAWGPDGRLAVLHEKELVLNAKDTENFLTALGFVRDLTQMIALNAASAGNGLGALFSAGVGQGGGFLDQTVTIHAEFPNATNHSEIEEAFSNLIGLASQYAGRRK